MAQITDEALGAGAIGFSAGTYYPPASHATTEEIIAAAMPLKAHGGRYVTHMRNEDDRIIAAMTEAFRIGREVGAPVIISHHNVVGVRNYGRSEETPPCSTRRAAARKSALIATPNIASSTMLRAGRIGLSDRIVITWSKALRITRCIRLKGDLGEDRRQNLLRIADRCPVHKTLEGKPVIVTTLEALEGH